MNMSAEKSEKPNEPESKYSHLNGQLVLVQLKGGCQWMGVTGETEDAPSTIPAMRAGPPGEDGKPTPIPIEIPYLRGALSIHHGEDGFLYEIVCADLNPKLAATGWRCRIHFTEYEIAFITQMERSIIQA